MSVNKVILVGNLGADPEVKTTNSGTTVANLRIATSERVKAADEWKDHTEWHRVVCFGRTAENVSRFLKKGRQVYIEGKLRTQKWQDKDGNDRYTTEIVAFNVSFLGGKGATPDNAGAGGYSGGGYSGGSANNAQESDQFGGPNDDIPF